MTKNPLNQRIDREKIHSRFLASNNPQEIWNWDSPAGKIRWQRRKNLLLDEISSGSKVLEIGCGTGLLSAAIGKMDVRFTAIDVSESLIEIARKNNVDNGIDFRLENACDMSFSDHSFDIVIGSSIFHHLDVDLAIGEFFRVLKPGGKIVFTEPNMMNPQIALQKNWPYLKRKLGDSPDETAFFRWKLKKQLLKGGFEQVQIDPFDFMHPAIPGLVARNSASFFIFLEKIPVLREIAGSLFIKAIKIKC
jgi:ubiquinone/menaquinone biosynthesis C-methylase UbiE